jgi:hypothetical protein
VEEGEAGQTVGGLVEEQLAAARDAEGLVGLAVGPCDVADRAAHADPLRRRAAADEAHGEVPRVGLVVLQMYGTRSSTWPFRHLGQTLATASATTSSAVGPSPQSM